MPNRGAVQTIKQNGVTIIALSAEYAHLDEPVLEQVQEPILEAAGGAEPPLVVLDLSETKFFGSSFIEVLFRAWNRIGGRDGGRFAICGLTPYCAEVVQVTHLDRLWEIYETRDDAVRALSGAA